MAVERTEPIKKSSSSKKEDDIDLLVDSAASRHMLRHPEVFPDVVETTSRIQTCQEGTTIAVAGSGTAQLHMGNSDVKLQHAFLVPKLEANLLSLGRIQQSGGSFRSSGTDKMIIEIQGAVIVKVGAGMDYNPLSSLRM